MRKVFRLLIHDEQRRLKQLWRQHEADVERWFPTRPSSSSQPEDTCARADACTHTPSLAITTHMVRLVSPLSRLSASRRPRGAGLTALTGIRASPVLANM
jgi:hypothetical protein